MTFQDVAALLMLIGGAIVGTFEITWKVSEKIHGNKKD